jgi:arylsulfatase A-like enzyme
MSMNFDLFTTVLELAGVEPPRDRIIDGKNIMPVLKGSKESPHETLYFYWRDNLWAVRHNQWKYHRKHQVEDINTYPWPRITKKGPFMYNLKTDLNESYSMIEKYPEIAKKLSALMDNMDRSVHKNPRGWL